MSKRQRVRTTCTDCGTVEPELEAAALVVDVEGLRLAFPCPSCGTEQSCELDSAMSRLLTSAGVTVAAGDTPLPRQRLRAPHWG